MLDELVDRVEVFVIADYLDPGFQLVESGDLRRVLSLI
jgi:hypothetical protein